MNDRKRWVVVSIGLFLVISFLAGVLIWRVVDRALYNRFPDRGVPRINIDLNGVSLDEIKGGTKDVKYGGNDLQIYNNGEILEFGGVEVKGRGNLTWLNEKKPYRIKFEKKTDLFGLGKARKWVLLANATDVTNLRTAAAFYLEDLLDMEFKFDGKCVELYIDGDYIGLYYLTHTVEIGKNVVDLTDSMGVLVELDNLYYESEDYYESMNGDHLVVKDVVNVNNKDESMREFMREYNEFEKAVMNGDYGKVNELIDVESFARYYLLSEFSVNPDAYWTSFYMYKDGVDDKIHAGPGWDFDFAFANKRWGNWMGEEFYSPEKTMVRNRELMTWEEYEVMDIEDNVAQFEMSQKLSRIIFDLMSLPEFREEVTQQYLMKMNGKTNELGRKILEWSNTIIESAERDSAKWYKGDYDQGVKDMVEWIEKRSIFFEKEYGGLHNGDEML